MSLRSVIVATLVAVVSVSLVSQADALPMNDRYNDIDIHKSTINSFNTEANVQDYDANQWTYVNGVPQRFPVIL